MKFNTKVALGVVAWILLGASAWFLWPSTANAADRTQRRLTEADITADSRCGASAVGKRWVTATEYRIQRREVRHKRVGADGFWTTCGEYDCAKRDLGTKGRLVPNPRVLDPGDAGDKRLVRYGVAGPNPNVWIGTRTYTCTPPFWTTGDALPAN